MVNDETLIRSNTLSRQITAILRKEILAGFKPGDRLPSAQQLATRFKVSFHTVREGLSALTEEGLIERRVGSGTYVSDMTKGRHVGVLVEYDISNPRTSYFYRRVPQQVMRFLREWNVPARLYAGHLPPGEDTSHSLTCTEFLDAVGRCQLSGVVAFAPTPSYGQWLEPLRQNRVPVVGGSGQFDCEVRVYDAALAHAGVEYLLNRGRRRIAIMQYYRSPEERSLIEGSFNPAMAAAGLDINPRWIRHDLHPCAPGAGWEEFREIWVSGKEKPDGLFIYDDNLFPGAAMAILQLGIRVPEDLLVVTHCHKGSGMINPFPVAKLEVDPDACARTLAEALLKLMRKETVGKLLHGSYELVEAAATAPRKNVAGDPATARSAVTSAPIAVANVNPTPRPNRRRKDEILV